MLKKMMVVLATMTAAVALAPLASAPVSAAPVRAAAAVLAPESAARDAAVTATCSAGYLCFWVDIDYGTPKGQVAGNNPSWNAFPQAACTKYGTWSDCASSAMNRGTQCTAHLHTDTNYGGTKHSIERGGNRRNLGDYGMNDNVSSNSWC